MCIRYQSKTTKDRMRPLSGSKKVRNMRPVSRSNDAAVTPRSLLFQAQAYQSPEDWSLLSSSDNIFCFSIIVCCVRSPHFWSPCPSPASQTRAVQKVLNWFFLKIFVRVKHLTTWMLSKLESWVFGKSKTKLSLKTGFSVLFLTCVFFFVIRCLLDTR